MLSKKTIRYVSLLQIYLIITLTIAAAVLGNPNIQLGDQDVSLTSPDSYNNPQVWDYVIAKGEYQYIPWDSINTNNVPWDKLVAKGNVNQVPWDKIKHDRIPNAHVGKVPEGKLKFAELTDEQKRYVTDKQLSYAQGKGLQEAGDLSQYNAAAVSKALNTIIKGGAKFQFTLTTGAYFDAAEKSLYIKDYQKPCPSLREDIDFRCQLKLTVQDLGGKTGVISVLQVETEQGIAKGFTVCAGTCKKVAGVAKEVELAADDKGNLNVVVTLVGGRKVVLGEGGVNVFVDKAGHSAILSDDKSKVLINGIWMSVENGKTGILVPPGDADSLGRALRETKPETLREYADEAAGKIQKNFRLDRMIRETTALYAR